MKNKPSCGPYPLLRIRLSSALALAGLLACALPARAGAPEWLRAAARAPLPVFPKDTDAVVLLDERITTVKNNAEIVTLYRRAYKILGVKGREQGTFGVHFDDETRLTYLKAWSLPAETKEYEVKEKDAVETSGPGVLYSDARYKILRIPAADPGHVIGYEYEQKRRPNIFQDFWDFQSELPVRRARFTLQLPAGWDFEAICLHCAELKPRRAGENQWIWELEDIPGIDREPAMPSWLAIARRLAVTYYPRTEGARGERRGSWNEVGQWYARLTSGMRQATPEIQKKVAELTAASTDAVGKMRALAVFVQNEIRYVAIEIGIGGYQPHPAAAVWTHRYGDCKDKVTLLSTMLREMGIESYYVLVHAERGAVAKEFPSPLNFNHAILAVRVPEGLSVAGMHASTNHPVLGRLFFFDPTDPHTRFGFLPPKLHGSYGLLVTQDGGELLQLPALAPSTNRLIRAGKLSLSLNGTLSGTVQEVRWGPLASDQRERLLPAQGADRVKVLENFLGSFLGGFLLTSAHVENLADFDKSLVLHYRFVAENYAKTGGNLLLVRARVLGQKSNDLLEKKERKYPVEFRATSVESDEFEIEIPRGYTVDELPVPLAVDYGFASYQSKVEVSGNVLRYVRIYQVRDVSVPTSRLDELRKLYRQIAGDERASVVLKPSHP